MLPHIFDYLVITALLLLVIRGMIREFKRVKTKVQIEAQDIATFIDLRRNDYRHMQNWVGAWSDRVLRPKGVTLQGSYKHLIKEMVELGKELDELYKIWSPISSKSRSPQETELLEKIGYELADIDIVTCHIAHLLGIQIAPRFLEKMQINEDRKWQEANAEGVSQHIDE